MKPHYMLAKMTWPEVEERLKESDIAIVPVGSTEQHGPALPLDNDHFAATQFAKMVAEKLWDNVKVVVTPPIAFGYSPHHMGFKGTITLRESTLADVIVDICTSLAIHGFKKIVLINGHGGNATAIGNALHLLHEKIDAQVFNIDWWVVASDKILEVATRPVYHACDMETSVSMYLGQRVQEDKLVDEPGKSPVPGFVEPDLFAPPPKVSMMYTMKDITDSGVVGYATKATKEKGKQIAEVALNRTVKFIMELAKS
ncbi:MAG: creatininase family protein [Candidatus Hermodarchaeota archaeon]|nr:creatininase family protein [Candidatus Hermodarchaeota archaeon]